MLYYTVLKTEWDYLMKFGMYITSIPLYFTFLQWLYGKMCKSFMIRIFGMLGISTLGIYALNERIIVPLSHISLFPLQNEIGVFVVAIIVTAACLCVTKLIRMVKVFRIITLGEK